MKDSFMLKEMSESDYGVSNDSFCKSFAMSLDKRREDSSSTRPKDKIVRKERSVDNEKSISYDRDRFSLAAKPINSDIDKIAALNLNHNRIADKIATLADVENSEIEDKTPTNDISISSINEMTDNSLLKDSLEGSAKFNLDAEGVKMDMVDEQEKELSTRDEKDIDTSERDNSASVGAWTTKTTENTTGTLLNIYVDI